MSQNNDAAMSQNNDAETPADPKLYVEALVGEMRRMMKNELAQINERLDRVENTNRRPPRGEPPRGELHRRNPTRHADESMATKKREPIMVPVGPVTRARAKQFKERLNGLIHKIQQEGSGLHMEGDQKLINIIQVTPTHIDQLVQDGIQVRSN